MKYDEEMKIYYEKHPEKMNEKMEKVPKKSREPKAVKKEIVEKSESESEKQESDNLFDEETD